MKNWSDYRIAFVGLKNDLHHFNFEIGNEFFSLFKDTLIQKGRVFIDLAFEKRERVFELDFDISGSVLTECDRCAVSLDLPIHGHYKVYVRIGHTDQNSDVDVIYISPDDTHLELTQLIYEFITLSIPIQKDCSEIIKGDLPCNTEALKVLEQQVEQQESDIDPRWEALKQLKKK